MAMLSHFLAKRFSIPSILPSNSLKQLTKIRPFTISSLKESDSWDLKELNQPYAYKKYAALRAKDIENLLKSPNRFQHINQRENRSLFTKEVDRAHYFGKNLMEHRGVDILTGVHDVVIYTQLLSYVRPATVFDLGVCTGGTSLLIADTLNLYQIKSQVYSMDIDLTLIDPRVHDMKPDNLTFLQGDCYKIEETFPDELLLSKPHPWILIEDAHENTLGVLDHFHKHMKEGDYIIFDDTNPNQALIQGMGLESFPSYQEIGPGKLETLKKFMIKYDKFYAVDSFFTDMFGYNVTHNWNGYIRKMA